MPEEIMPLSANAEGELPIPDIAASTDENLLVAPAEGSAEANKAVETYAEFLDQLGRDVPEAEKNRDALITTGSELIRRHGLGFEFFSNRGRAWAFTAIANRAATAEGDPAEQAFLDSALVLLGHQYSPQLRDRMHEGADLPMYSDEHQLHVIDRYTQHQVTADLKASLDQGLLDDVKDALGVTPDNDDDIDVRVLSIGAERDTYGLSVPPAPDWDSIEGDLATKRQVVDSSIAVQTAVKDWRHGLADRTETFRQEIGWSDVAGAWMVRLSGRTLLCVTLPVAEKVLYPETTAASKWYGQKQHDQERAIIGHERVHCTGEGLMINGEHFGITAEEVRAEHFSGNRQGYQDAKGFGNDLGLITGRGLVTYMEGKIKGGTAYDLCAGLANSVGMNRALEVMMVRPRNYIASEPNQHGRVVDEYIAGYNGVLARLYQDAVANGREDEINARLDQTLHSLEAKGVDAESYAGYRRIYGVTYVSDMLERRAGATSRVGE